MPDPVSYTAVLPIGEPPVVYVSGLLNTERRRRRSRRGRRALGSWRHAVLVLRWFLDATRLAQLAADNQISSSTAYRYLHEGIDVLAAAAPGLHGALLAAWTSPPPAALVAARRASAGWRSALWGPRMPTRIAVAASTPGQWHRFARDSGHPSGGC